MNETELKQIEQLGYLQMSIEKVRIIMQVDADVWLIYFSTDTEVSEAYYRGVYRSEAEFRQTVFDLAKRNSSQAQEMVQKFIDDRAKSNV